MTAPSIKEALEFYAEQYCEGWCWNSADCSHFEDCGGCLARRALATLPPAGERREAIARALAEKWPGDYMHGDDECEREPNALAYETADAAILASGLVQDEAGIRADEREKCAKIADREAEFWQDAESSSARIVAANIRSARNRREG